MNCSPTIFNGVGISSFKSNPMFLVDKNPYGFLSKEKEKEREFKMVAIFQKDFKFYTLTEEFTEILTITYSDGIKKQYRGKEGEWYETEGRWKGHVLDYSIQLVTHRLYCFIVKYKRKYYHKDFFKLLQFKVTKTNAGFPPEGSLLEGLR